MTSNAIFLMGFILADFVISCLLFFLGNSAGVPKAFESSVWLLSLLTAAAMGAVILSGLCWLQAFLENAQVYAYFLC